MTDENMRTIEIDGIKLEVDMRTAKKVETYKVGDRIKILEKNYSGYVSHPGVIVGFDCFEKLPTMILCYVSNPLSSDGVLTFKYLNAQSKDIEICPMCEDDIVPTRETMTMYFERAEAVKLRELEDIRTRKEYFLRQYDVAFAATCKEVAEAVSKTE